MKCRDAPESRWTLILPSSILPAISVESVARCTHTTSWTNSRANIAMNSINNRQIAAKGYVHHQGISFLRNFLIAPSQDRHHVDAHTTQTRDESHKREIHYRTLGCRAFVRCVPVQTNSSELKIAVELVRPLQRDVDTCPQHQSHSAYGIACTTCTCVI